MLLFDGSGSVCDNEDVTTCENWKNQRLFLRYFIEETLKANADHRIAGVRFKSGARIDWWFSSSDTFLHDTSRKLDYAGWRKSSAHIGLRFIKDYFFTESQPKRTQIVVFIFDGISNNYVNRFYQRHAQVVDLGVTVVPIAVKTRDGWGKGELESNLDRINPGVMIFFMPKVDAQWDLYLRPVV